MPSGSKIMNEVHNEDSPDRRPQKGIANLWSGFALEIEFKITVYNMLAKQSIKF